MFTSLGNVIPTDWARRYTFDGNGSSTTGSNNAAVTNPVWVKSQRMYQNQCLSWGATTSCTYASVTYTNSYIWIYSSGVWTFTKNSSKVTATALNGVTGERYAGLTFFNRILTSDEEQLLQLEGQKLLGPTSVAKYPKLFEGLVGYFENPTGTTELWNIANGVNSTRVAGSNTTDNLGNNRALSNPNYTWTSITYTTGYTFENSGSGWSIVTNPLGLLGTGINRVTTLRNVFLFTRTLSSDEVTLLQNLCNSNYIYPNPSYDLPNLRDGLVLDLNEQGKDLSGNGNNATLVNSPTVVRQGKTKGLSYNGSNQYLSGIISGTGFSGISIGGWFYNNSSGSVGHDMGTIILNNSMGFGWGFGDDFYIYLSGSKTYIGSVVRQKIQHIIAVYENNSRKLYINGVLIFSDTTNVVRNMGTYEIGRGNFPSVTYMPGNIFYPKIRNRALFDREVQQLYYSQKANFVY